MTGPHCWWRISCAGAKGLVVPNQAPYTSGLIRQDDDVDVGSHSGLAVGVGANQPQRRDVRTSSGPASDGTHQVVDLTLPAFESSRHKSSMARRGEP